MEKTLICTKKLQICQTRPYSPGEQLSWKNQIFYLYGSEGRMNGCLSKQHRQICRKRTPCDHRSNLKKTTVFFTQKHNCEYLFLLWTENVQIFLNFFAKGVKTELYVSRRTYWKKTSLQEVTFLYLFKILLRTFWLDGKLHGRQEGILRDQLKVSGKNFWEKPKFLKFCEMS